MSITKRIRFKEDPLRDGFNAPVSNDRGSAIIIVLVILVVLTLLGQIATRTTNTEMKIAANDKRHRVTFYDADGATELASELLEQNIDTLGFDDTTPGFDTGDNTLFGFVGLEIADFWRNGEEVATTPTDLDRDFFLPADYAAGEAHTNFTVGGVPQFAEGAGIPMAAGYEGMGKGAGGGGVWIIYNVRAQHEGVHNSTSRINQQWRHVM